MFMRVETLQYSIATLGSWGIQSNSPELAFSHNSISTLVKSMAQFTRLP